MLEDLTEAEIVARLEIELRRMPKMRREVFLAIRLDDLGYPEIAELTGLTVPQVEQQFAQALLQLHRALNDPSPISSWKRAYRWITGKAGR